MTVSQLPLLVLASKSPRRAELLQQIGVPFEQISVDIDERPHANEAPDDLVLRLAREKALAGLALAPGRHVMGSDTIVVCAGRIMGKPKDADDSHAMLSQLSGTTHRVLSAVALAGPNRLVDRLSSTDVRFRELSEAEIRCYWDTGEPRDKAGSYAIQGLAATFISRIEGSYSGVMGLPLFETSELLTESGLPFWPNGTL